MSAAQTTRRSPGIYWLRRRRDSLPRIGFYCRSAWRVADAIGRTRVYSSIAVDRLFDVGARVFEPFDEVE